MATIKSHTDIQQSERLAEILPIETADMYYHPYPNDEDWYDIPDFGEADLKFNQLPCWSLSALLGVLNFPALRYDIEDGEGGWIVGCEKNDKGYLSHYRDNPVDTCYEMILRLHEQNLI